MSKYIKSDKERGDGRDYRRFARCRVCGFINDTTKRATGEGIGYTVVALINEMIVTLDTDTETVMEDTSLTSLYVPHEQKVHSGCSFCGSLNWL